ncbi:unnamed protein product [marine sediment metagenome]|uniref:DUF2815 family protein n=1 Tax=marine sediment metagenome TaxID=412755 RepID=X0VTU1_9ZZZZ
MTVKNTDTKVITGKVRLSYAHIFKATTMDGKDPKFSVCLLVPKSDKTTLRAIKTAVDAAKQQGLSLWGGKLPVPLKLPLRDGDEERPDQPEYAAKYFLNATSKQRPGIVDKGCQEILDSTEVYSGCYGRASVNFYPFNQAGHKGVACGLNNIQKLTDGDYLGGRSKPEDDFEAVEDTTADEDYLS